MATGRLYPGSERIRDVERVQGLVDCFFRILIRCGVPSASLLEMARAAVLERADRTSVRELQQPPEHHLACTDVVFLWRREPAFLDGSGRPKVLPRHGATGSFDQLTSLAASGHDSESILQYLTALGAVALRKDGYVELTAESVLACTGSRASTIAPRTILAHLSGFLGSVEYNLCVKRDVSSGRFERACYASIPRSLVPVLQRLVENRGQNFVDSVDEWLVRHRDRTDASSLVQVGAGAYVFIHDMVQPDQN